MSRAISSRWLSSVGLVVVGVLIPHATPPVQPSLYAGLAWRNIGPFRGGRVSAVTGVIGQPGVFYAGFPLGGVWKTTSAGMTWYPIMDAVKEASSVGAVQVAPSDPNVIYVGMGDLITGGGINEGNGVYKSTDAGKTWTHLGLDDTKQIPSILVDPHNPNLVMVAAQGNIHTHTDQRGVFRSTDGGKTWTKTLYIDNETGVQEIAWAYDNPKVMLATTVRHYSGGGGRGGGGGGGAGASTAGATTFAEMTASTMTPAQHDSLCSARLAAATAGGGGRGGGRGGRGGGGGGGGGAAGASGTALYKSMDEGVTWQAITCSGLPELSGRTSIAVANNTNSQRMFIISNTALYRSDDGGTTWRQMAANDGRIHNGQNGYNCGVYVDPQNPDIVYTINTSSFKSTDGGNTFTGFKGAPGGDDPQQMWIDPTNGQRMLLGVDQGATISLDGGQNWSSWYNQSTEQVYHISVDNSYPYWVYATQQDAGSIGTRSRGDLGEISPWDWYPTAGYEFGFIVADPLNPKIVYARGEGSGSINKITYPNGQYIDVSPTIEPNAALRGGNPPMDWSPENQHELMVGYQYLMASTDGGMHWKKLSPDLTYPKGQEPPAAGAAPAGGRGRGGRGGRGAAPAPDSATRAALAGARTAADSARIRAAAPAPAAAPAAGGGGRGGGGGGSIAAFSPSTVTAGTIWVGTSNGLVKVTKDGGAHWQDVTIPDAPAGVAISSIDASHLDSATAYVAVDHHGTGDYKPYLYRTHDYGKTWTAIVNGLAVDQPSGSFTRVLRADTKKAGLLFAGTESSMYVSFDDGDNWQSLQLNLPNTSFRDMVIKDNDLVVGTYGRGIWILDDYSPLRQMTPAVTAEPAHLFKPGDQIRVRRNVNGDTPIPPEIPHAENPPLGVIVYYSLASKPAGEISLDVSDAAGKPVRHYSSAPIGPLLETPPTLPDFWLEVRKPMPTEVGTNRMNWDMRYDPPYSATHSIGQTMGAVAGETVPGPEGPLVAPGTYTLKLTVDGKSYTQTVGIRNDPRSPASAADLRAQHELQMKIYDDSKAAHDASLQVAVMCNAVAAVARGNPPAAVMTADTLLGRKLLALGGAGGGGGGGRGGGGGGGGGGGRGGGGGGGGAGCGVAGAGGAATGGAAIGAGGGAGGGAFVAGPTAGSTFSTTSGTMNRHLTSLDMADMAPNQPIVDAFTADCAEYKTSVTMWRMINTKDLVALNALLTKNSVTPIPAATSLPAVPICTLSAEGTPAAPGRGGGR